MPRLPSASSYWVRLTTRCGAQPGVAEHFQIQQNRQLLERLSARSGGRYFTLSELDELPETIEYSEAGIVERELLDLWNMALQLSPSPPSQGRRVGAGDCFGGVCERNSLAEADSGNCGAGTGGDREDGPRSSGDGLPAMKHRP